MNRLFLCFACATVAIAITACASDKPSLTTNKNTNQPAQAAAKDLPAKPQETQPTTSAPGGELQPGQASGSFTAKGQNVELKYAYAGRAQRFGSDALVILITESPIPPEALAEQIKSATMLEDEKIRGLEYVMMDENSMWVRYHPGQYQESSSNKLKDYKVENDIVRGTDANENDLSNGKHPRSVKFVAAIAK
jgi:hypothetical protein